MDFKNLQDKKIYNVTLEMPGIFIKRLMALAKTPEDTIATVIQNALGLYKVARGLTDKNGDITIKVKKGKHDCKIIDI